MELKYTIKSIVIVILGLFLIDRLVGFVGFYAIDNLPDFGDKIAKDKYRLEKASSDIIVLGSSRANGNYVVPLLRDSINNYMGTNYTMYNAGGEGQTANYACCVAENMIKRKVPKIIIWEVRNYEFSDGGTSNALSFFNPYYHTNSIVKNYINRIGPIERLKIQSNMYCFNYKLLRFILSTRYVTKPNDGFENNNTIMKLKGKYTPPSTIDFSSPSKYVLENAERLVKICKDSNIILIMATSPQYNGSDNNEFLHNFCRTHHIPYVDMYSVGFFNGHPELWRDPNHLNLIGAIEYDNLFFQKLKKYI